MESVPKKRAARKVATKVASSLSKDTAQKKKPTPKKTAPVKSKEVARKSTSKDVVSLPISITKRAARPPRASATLPSKHSSSRKSVAPLESDPRESVALVTGTPSLRLKEKLALYEAWYRDESHRYVQPIAQGFGYFFVGFGFLLAYVVSNTPLYNHLSLVASLECAVGTTCETVSTDQNGSGITHVLPKVSFPEPLIITPGSDSELIYVLENTDSHTLFLESQTDGRTVEISTDNSPARLPTATLPPGAYVLSMRVTSGEQIAEFTGPSFVITESRPLETTNEPMLSQSAAVVNSLISTESASTTTPETGSRTASEELEEQADVLSETTTESGLNSAFALSLNTGFFDNQYRLSIVPTYHYKEVLVYARSLNATFSYFLGSATADAKGWFYWLDAKNLPAGSYYLVVEGIDEGVVKDRAEIRFVNETYNHHDDSEERLSFVEKSENLLTSLASSTGYSELMDPRTPLIPLTLSPESDTYVARSARELLVSQAQIFESLARRYGAFIQTENETLQSALSETVDETMRELLAEVLMRGDFDGSILSLELELRRQFDELLSVVQALEEDKRQLSNDTSRFDGDGDGVPDIEEALLFKTNPASPDTDFDGVLDGIEIAKNYNPSVAMSETILTKDYLGTLQSIGLPWRPLAISRISPLLVYESEDSAPTVQLEVSGVSIPNSFVTIFNKETTLLASVYTSADGSFSHTMQASLEDGHHVLYAALADNAGKMVVVSEPLTFVKAGTQITTGVSPQTTAPVIESPTNTLKAPYTFVAAMAVVSLGLVLLLLAQTVRREKVLQAA